jgi:hypothetical protein
MNRKKETVAALAAVAAYIKSGQDAQMFLAQSEEEPSYVTPFNNNIWGSTGRQAQMQMRSLLQMKSFHGTKMR